MSEERLNDEIVEDEDLEEDTEEYAEDEEEIADGEFVEDDYDEGDNQNYEDDDEAVDDEAEEPADYDDEDPEDVGSEAIDDVNVSEETVQGSHEVDLDGSDDDVVVHVNSKKEDAKPIEDPHEGESDSDFSEVSIRTKITKDTIREIYQYIYSPIHDAIFYLLLGLGLIVIGIDSVYIKNYPNAAVAYPYIMYILYGAMVCALIGLLGLTVVKSMRLKRRSKVLVPYLESPTGIACVTRFKKDEIEVTYPVNQTNETKKRFTRPYKDVVAYEFTDNYMLLACHNKEHCEEEGHHDRLIPVDIDKADDNDIETLLIKKNLGVKEKKHRMTILFAVFVGLAFVIAIIGILDYANVFPEITALVDELFENVMSNLGM